MAGVPPSAQSRGPGPWLRSRVERLGYAAEGVRVLVATQPHARLHLAATALVLAAGWAGGLERWEWAAVALASGMVWTAEAVNTAAEWIVDLAHPAWGARAGRIKDVAAGAVLLAAVSAAAVGVIVFGPRLLQEFGM